MKKLNILPAGLLAAAALATLASGAKAQTVTSNQGDLFLGFNDPANTSYDYVVDLGPASYFLSLSHTAGTTDITTADYGGAGLGNIANDLATAFGTSWYANGTTGSNVQWGIVGTSGINTDSPVFGLNNDTVFFTVGELTPGSGSTGPTAFGASTQNTDAKDIEEGLAGAFDGQNQTSNSSVATIESTSLANNWGSYLPQSHAFGSNDNVEQPTSGSFTGPTDSQLDLYELVPTNDGGSTHGTELGSFTLSQTGQLEFTSAAVPEPSTYATVGLGAALLLLVRRKGRKVVAG